MSNYLRSQLKTNSQCNELIQLLKTTVLKQPRKTAKVSAKVKKKKKINRERGLGRCQAGAGDATPRRDPPTGTGILTPGPRGWIWQGIGFGVGKVRAGIDGEQTSQHLGGSSQLSWGMGNTERWQQDSNSKFPKMLRADPSVALWREPSKVLCSVHAGPDTPGVPKCSFSCPSPGLVPTNRLESQKIAKQCKKKAA